MPSNKVSPVTEMIRIFIQSISILKERKIIIGSQTPPKRKHLKKNSNNTTLDKLEVIADGPFVNGTILFQERF